MGTKRDNHQFSTAIRKAEVKNCSETKLMQKSIEQSYKEHKQTVKNIQKEQARLISRAKLQRLQSKKDQATKRIHPLINVEDYELQSQQIEPKDTSQSLPNVRIEDTRGSNAFMTSSLNAVSPAVKRCHLPLCKSGSASFGSLESVLQRTPAFPAQRHGTLKRLRNLSVGHNNNTSHQSIPERQGKKDLSYSSSYSYDSIPDIGSMKEDVNPLRRGYSVPMHRSLDPLPGSMLTRTRNRTLRNSFRL